MKTIALLFAITLSMCLGCQQSTMDAQAAYAEAEHQAALEQAGFFDAGKANQSSESELDLSNIDSFCDAFKQKFNVDKESAFTEFTSWDGMDAGAKKANMELFLDTANFMDGLDGKLEGVVRGNDFEEYKSLVSVIQLPNSALAATPTHILFAYVVNENDGATAVHYPVTKVNGRFYICPAIPN